MDRAINVHIEGDTARLPVADFRALLSPREQRALEAFEARCGAFGATERRSAPMTVEKTGNTGDVPGYYVRGHAAVHDRRSLDLGGFYEVVDRDAFNAVLDGDPLVHLNWDHDMGRALASTRSNVYRLELRTDPKGLHFYAKVAPTTAAKDLRILMEGGVIDQASFAFTVAEDTWEIRNQGQADEVVVRTILRVGDLFDVTVTAQGAYPATDSQVVRSYAVAFARSNDKLPDAPDTHDAPAATEDADPPAASPSQAETPEHPATEAVETADNPVETADPAAPETSEAPPEAVAPPAEAGEGATEPLPQEGEAQPEVPEAHPLVRALRFDMEQTLREHKFLLDTRKP
jgi:HK97 family phage prohead protease